MSFLSAWLGVFSLGSVDWSWWPVLRVPFPFVDGGVVVDLTMVDVFLRDCGSVVGPLLVFVAVFLIVRRLLVSFSGGD